MAAPAAARRAALHPSTTALALLGAAGAGAAAAGSGHPALAVWLLALTTGAAAGFANSGST